MFDMHIMIVQSAFNRDITDQLFSGAVSVLDKNNATYEPYIVPGAASTASSQLPFLFP